MIEHSHFRDRALFYSRRVHAPCEGRLPKFEHFVIFHLNMYTSEKRVKYGILQEQDKVPNLLQEGSLARRQAFRHETFKRSHLSSKPAIKEKASCIKEKCVSCDIPCLPKMLENGQDTTKQRPKSGFDKGARDYHFMVHYELPTNLASLGFTNRLAVPKVLLPVTAFSPCTGCQARNNRYLRLLMGRDRYLSVGDVVVPRGEGSLLSM